MTKYVGKHRAKSPWTPQRRIATGLAAAGFISAPSQVIQAEVPHDKPPVPSPAIRQTASEQVRYWTAPPGWVVPTPPSNGDGLQKFREWVDAGKPGYIPEQGTSKGISANVQEPDPVPEPPQPVGYPDCPRGPGSSLGLTPDADLVYRAVCSQFPSITTYYGYRAGDQDHGTGNAVDCMVYDDTATGYAVVNFLMAHRGEFNIKYIIWQQRIAGDYNNWTWELMEDRGSPTQNHMDHVHVSVY